MKKTILAVLLTGTALLTTACTSTTYSDGNGGPAEARPQSSASPSVLPLQLPTSAPTSEITYPFSSGKYPGKITSFQVTLNGKTKTYAKPNEFQMISGCTVIFSSGTRSKARGTVTQSQQAAQSDIPITTFITQQGPGNTKPVTSTLATTQTVNGKPVLMETKATAFTAKGKTIIAHYRIFANDYAVGYIQICKNDAVINVDKDVRLVLN